MDADTTVDARVTDPVCGMRVDPATSPHHFEHHETTYSFCAAGCRTRFAADPGRYLQPRVAQPAKPGAIHTCPMHPEIRQHGPGACPICGMALEPLEITAEAPPNAELRDMTRRLWMCVAFAVPLLILSMGGHVMPFGLANGAATNWAQLLLATPVVLWAGWPFFQRGWASVVSRNPNMFTLIALGTGAAWLYSVTATLAPGLFPAGFRSTSGTVDVYYESAVVIVVLVLVGQVLELRARERTGDAIRALLRLAPRTARRLRDGGAEEDVAIDRIAVGDRLRVRPGEAIPVDGVVVEGRSAVDEALVTGEAAPVAKADGDTLIGGTVNGAGGLVMRAEKVGAETLLARIVAMVADAQRSRAPIQRLADGVAAWFVPAVLVVAALTFLAWTIWGPSPSMAYGLVAAVSVLMIACPCALGLATPMSIGVGMGRGAGAGVLIRSADALERMEKVDTLVIDKTGTLTEGKPRVTDVMTLAGMPETELLTLAASLERASEHPLAAAVVAAAPGDALEVTEFASVTGQGVTGSIGGRRVALGNAALMAGLGIALDGLDSEAEVGRREGATVLFAAVDGRAAGVIAIADPIKPTAEAALRALRGGGLRIVMLTGDNPVTAQAVARSLGIVDVHADARPDDKHRIVRALRAQGRIVAMAGDGVNDAPALAAADIGIAMGTGTDVAIQSAAITLIRGDLAGIVRARTLSRATMRNIRQNLVFAFAYNIVGLPVAAGALYPVFGLLLSPMIAALAMSLSSVSVITNALRLRALKL